MKTIKYRVRHTLVADMTTTMSDSEYEDAVREFGEDGIGEHILECIQDNAITLPDINDTVWDNDDLDVDYDVIVINAPPVAVDEHGFHEETP